jgi:hypothetical protein
MEPRRSRQIVKQFSMRHLIREWIAAALFIAIDAGAMPAGHLAPPPAIERCGRVESSAACADVGLGLRGNFQLLQRQFPRRPEFSGTILTPADVNATDFGLLFTDSVTPTQMPTQTPTATPSPTATITPVPVAMSISPRKLNFGPIKVGIRSKPKSVKIGNPKGSRQHVGRVVTIGGVSATGDFSISPRNCWRCSRRVSRATF